MQQPNHEPEKYAALSRHYIQKADEYLQAGDRVQASEKGWGAVAEAIKSIAEQRGWNHRGHRLLNDAAYLLCEEWQRPDLMFLYDAVEKLHINYYEDDMELDEIGGRIITAKNLLQQLDTLRRQPQRPVSITTRSERNRWRRLTGELLPIATGEGE